MSQVFDYAETLKEIATHQVEQTRKAISHAGEKGRSFEHIVRGMLRPLLPKRYAIGTGFIVGSDGGQSRQTDIVVYDELMNTPIFLSGDVGVYPIECVYAAIEVKSWVDRDAIEASAEAIGGIRNLKSQKTFRVPVVSYNNEQRPMGAKLMSVNVPIAPRSYLFAFGAKAGTTLDSLTDAVKECSSKHRSVFHAVYVQEQAWLIRQVKDGDKLKTKQHGSNSWNWLVRYLLRDLSSFAMFPADMERYLGQDE